MQAAHVNVPYTAIIVSGNTIDLYGKKVLLNDNGFPQQVQTFFNAHHTALVDSPNNLLYEGIHFHFTKTDGKDFKLQSKGVNFTSKQPGFVQWKAGNINDSIKMEVTGFITAQGFAEFSVTVTALQNISLKEITMHIPFKKEVVPYFKGLGITGGPRPEIVNWKWQEKKDVKNLTWTGSDSAGLQYSLEGDVKSSFNFHHTKKTRRTDVPNSWENNGKGGITVGIKGSSMLANNYSGAREMQKGEVLLYYFNCLITPLHTTPIKK